MNPAPMPERLDTGNPSDEERLMLANRINGVSADDDLAGATLGAIRQLGRDRQTVRLPKHDPESASRPASHWLVDEVALATSR